MLKVAVAKSRARAGNGWADGQLFKWPNRQWEQSQDEAPRAVAAQSLEVRTGIQISEQWSCPHNSVRHPLFVVSG